MSVVKTRDVVFDRGELAARLARVRAAMDRDGIELLVLSDPCNIYYLTGYDAWSFYTPQALLVGPDGEPLWFGRQMDTTGVGMTTWLETDSILGYPDALVQNPPAHPFTDLAEHLRARGWDRLAIGVEMHSYYFSAGSFDVLQRELPQARWRDASLLVNWARFIKSPAEIALLRQAGQLLTRSMLAGIETLGDGVREDAAVARIYASQIADGDGPGGAYTSSPAFVMSGERTATPHLPWTERALTRGTAVNFELMGNRRRYQVTQGRTIHIGPAPEPLRRLEGILLDAIADVLGFIRPGVTCGEVADRLQAALARNGIVKESRCGYSQGIAYPPTGGELTASFRKGDRTELQAGAVMHFLPALWQDQHSLVISEPLVVTDSGCECLCSTPRQLFVRD